MWSVEFGSVECGVRVWSKVWSVKCGVWSVECGVSVGVCGWCGCVWSVNVGKV